MAKRYVTDGQHSVWPFLHFCREFNIDRYCLYSNNTEENSRSILTYVSK